MAKFKLGQRVKVLPTYSETTQLIGKIGTVADISSYRDTSPAGVEYAGVRFSSWSNGHDMNGEGKNEGIVSGWYIEPKYLKVVASKGKKAKK